MAEAIERYTPERVNRIHGFGHAWLASFGAWRELLASDLVNDLLTSYGSYLEEGGYPVEGSGIVEPLEIARRWGNLVPPSSPLPADAYEAYVHVVDGVTSPTRTSSTITFFSKVENRGSARWPTERRHPRIRLGCQWLSSGKDGPPVLEGRCLIHEVLPPGGVTYQTATFPTPDEPGDYRLRISFVHEQVRWFGTPVELNVAVL